MQKEFVWNLFEKTGEINLYLYYKEYEELMNKHEKINYEFNDKNIRKISLR